MKKIYKAPSMEIEIFDADDVITMSGYSGTKADGTSSDTHHFFNVSWADFIS